MYIYIYRLFVKKIITSKFQTTLPHTQKNLKTHTHTHTHAKEKKL